MCALPSPVPAPYMFPRDRGWPSLRLCHPPERNVAMGLSWGRATGQHACPTRGVGFCSCWPRFLRDLARPVRRLLSGGGMHVRR